ncbi:MAG: helix-turn-helix transcriptional regulator [Gammaproteobacteria bacterium]|nr:helix-turn-helix transcriptional regulator [Gammaproteobacteria bacterium]
MYDYGEYCPISKAAQVLGERWTFQILREMHVGVTRFNEFRRYLPKLSPSLLNQRLHMLEEHGLVMKRRRPESQSFEYQLTEAGQALGPILMSLGNWAAGWIAMQFCDTDVNLDALMRDVQMSLVVDRLPVGRTVLLFQFTDLAARNKWYLVTNHGRAEICDEDRGLDVDVYVTCDCKCLAAVWHGEAPLAPALADGRIRLSGPPALLRSFSAWFGRSPFAQTREISLSSPTGRGLHAR